MRVKSRASDGSSSHLDSFLIQIQVQLTLLSTKIPTSAILFHRIVEWTVLAVSGLLAVDSYMGRDVVSICVPGIPIAREHVAGRVRVVERRNAKNSTRSIGGIQLTV